jgi:membrane associated rhomboid family serine protease
MLEDEARRFKTLVPDDPDQGLAYFTGSWNPLTMISSSFAHGDWGHILFNLVFFFAFAATVEVLIGPLWYIAFVLVDSWFIGLTGSLAAAAASQHYWTLGLSGIVMGMMGLFAFLLPRGKIKCYYFFIIVFGSVAIPGWALAAWYIGGDIFTLFAYDDYGVVNVMAHVMGGIGGYLFGAAFLREVRRDAVHLQADLDRVDFEGRFR